MKKLLGCLLLLISMVPNLSAQTDYKITIKAKNYPGELVQVAYYLADKTYLIPDDITKSDSLYRQNDGTFVLRREEPLPPGIHALVFHPEMNIRQFLITEQDQNITISFDYNDMSNTFDVQGGSGDNALFRDYLIYLNNQRNAILNLENQGINTQNSPEVTRINQEVANYRKKLLQDHPDSFTAAIVKSSMNIDLPTFSGTDDEIKFKNWQYYKNHYFDNLDLGDPRMLRTPILFEKVSYYMDKLQYKHPDTLIVAVDHVLQRMEPSPETFKVYLINFLNKFATSNLVGMDAVYVHLADTYYATGKTPWIEEEQLNKILDNAASIRPLLIGKTAPNISLIQRNGEKIDLMDISSKYTVLLFWKYDCGHCEDTIAELKVEYPKLQEYGVTLVAMCSNDFPEEGDCWSYIDQEGVQDWLHADATVPYEKLREWYKIETFPQIYVLDKDKKILSKRIGAKQIENVLRFYEDN